MTRIRPGGLNTSLPELLTLPVTQLSITLPLRVPGSLDSGRSSNEATSSSWRRRPRRWAASTTVGGVSTLESSCRTFSGQTFIIESRIRESPPGRCRTQWNQPVEYRPQFPIIPQHCIQYFICAWRTPLWEESNFKSVQSGDTHIDTIRVNVGVQSRLYNFVKYHVKIVSVNFPTDFKGNR
jgi:hypothetical protein